MSEEIANYFQTAWVHAAAGSLIVEESGGRMSYSSDKTVFLSSAM